jgi:uncharacterized membrane protein YoaK (UPF0700 family)
MKNKNILDKIAYAVLWIGFIVGIVSVIFGGPETKQIGYSLLVVVASVKVMLFQE